MGECTGKTEKPMFGAPTKRGSYKKRTEQSSVSPHFQKFLFKVEKLI
jgi:hypothetical protein